MGWVDLPTFKLQLPKGWDPLYGGEHPEVNPVGSLYGVNT